MKETLFIRQLTAFFDVHLPEVRHCRPNTIVSYADAFALFFQFMEEKQDISHNKIDYRNFTPALLENFIIWLAQERNCSASSIKQRLSAINSFMKYASRREVTALTAYTTVAGTEKPKVIQHPFPYFSLEEMKILLRLPDPDKKIEKRDLVLLSVFYDSAARAQELCGLKVGDVKFGSPTKLKLLGKGGKAREVPISDDVSKLLRYHLKENNSEGQQDIPLFASQLGGQMTTACVRNLVDKYVAKARELYPNLFLESKYSPHSFRHSKAVHLAESGVQLLYIRNFLGHASIQSTEIYARIGQNAIAKMLSERNTPASQQPSETIDKYERTWIPAFLDHARHQ